MWAGRRCADRCAVGLAVAGCRSAFVWTDYLWYESLGQQNVFWVRYLSMGAVWLVCTAVAFSTTYLSARAAWKSIAGKPLFNGAHRPRVLHPRGDDEHDDGEAVDGVPPRGGAVAVRPEGSAVRAWTWASSCSRCRRSSCSSAGSPGLIVLAMLVMVVVVFLSTRMDTTGALKIDWWSLKKNLSVLAGLLVLTAAANSVLAIWQLSFSTVETPFAGASYADVHAQLPAVHHSRVDRGRRRRHPLRYGRLEALQACARRLRRLGDRGGACSAACGRHSCRPTSRRRTRPRSKRPTSLATSR